MKKMKYTGRKDIKGKKIYEGDIIRSATDSFWQYIPTCVQWLEEIMDWNFLGNRFEVIGNIENNPELLNT